jgi:hypothetical protein
VDADTALESLLAEKPSQPASAFEGALQGASLGWGNKMEAGWKALAKRLLPKSLGGTNLPMGEQFKRDLAARRAYTTSAKEANPDTYFAAELAGGAIPGTVGTIATGGAGALPMAVGQGALAGAGYSDADSAGGLARDALVGGGVGLAGHAIGSGLGAAMSRLRGFAASRVGQAASRAAAQASEEEAAKIASLAGKYGGELQKGSRIGENLGRYGTKLSPAEQAAADAVKARVESGSLAALPGQAGTIDASEQALRAAQAGAPQAIAQRTAELSKPSFGADALSFAKSYAEPLVWGVAGQQGAKALGLDPKEQAVIGAVAGGIGGRTRAGKALAYRLNRPGNQQAMWGAVESAAPTIGAVFRNAIAAGRAPATAGALSLMAGARKRSDDNATLDALLKQDGSDAALDALLK